MHQPDPLVAGVGLVHVDVQPHHPAIPAALVQPPAQRTALDEALVAQGVDALVAPLHQETTDAATTVVRVDAHGIDACEHVSEYCTCT